MYKSIIIALFFLIAGCDTAPLQLAEFTIPNAPIVDSGATDDAAWVIQSPQEPDKLMSYYKNLDGAKVVNDYTVWVSRSGKDFTISFDQDRNEITIFGMVALK